MLLRLNKKQKSKRPLRKRYSPHTHTHTVRQTHIETLIHIERHVRERLLLLAWSLVLGQVSTRLWP